jgi:hypothetical protein
MSIDDDDNNANAGLGQPFAPGDLLPAGMPIGPPPPLGQPFAPGDLLPAGMPIGPPPPGMMVAQAVLPMAAPVPPARITITNTNISGDAFQNDDMVVYAIDPMGDSMMGVFEVVDNTHVTIFVRGNQKTVHIDSLLLYDHGSG